MTVVAAVIYATFLFLTQFVVAVLGNITVFEMMTGASFTMSNLYPHEKHYYKMSLVYNFVQIFGMNPLLWFLPLVVEVPHFGLYFPQRPELRLHEKAVNLKEFYD